MQDNLSLESVNSTPETPLLLPSNDHLRFDVPINGYMTCYQPLTSHTGLIYFINR